MYALIMDSEWSKIIIAWLSLNFILETSWVALYSDVCYSLPLENISMHYNK